MSFAATVHRGMFSVKKHAPEILMGLGIAGLGLTIISSFKASAKCSDILEECNKELKHADKIMVQAKNNGGQVKRQRPDGTIEMVNYTEKDYLKDRRVIKVKTGWKLVKAAIPVVLCAAGTLIAFIFSHKIEKDRLKASLAAFGSVAAAFESYRKRIKEKYGDDADAEAYLGLKADKVDAVGPDGKKTKKEVIKEINEPGVAPGHSMYARYFDENSRLWKKDPEMNLLTLRAQQNAANDYLVAHGHLYLNEVYDMLDLPRSKAGQIVGWTYNPDNPKGDNYVDFGIYDIYNNDARNFVNGKENRILLDFNVEGNILGAM